MHLQVAYYNYGLLSADKQFRPRLSHWSDGGMVWAPPPGRPHIMAALILTERSRSDRDAR